MTESRVFLHAQKALIAMQKAVRDVLKEHKLLGDPIYVSREGHLQKIPASKIVLSRQTAYKKR